MNEIPIFIKHINEAERRIKIVDHFLYVTFPLLNDHKLLLKTLNELNEATINCVNAILQYEYYSKRIPLTKDQRTNFRIFTNKCSQRYNIEEQEMKTINEIINLYKTHKESPLEFVRENKIIIISDDLDEMRTTTITIEKIKEFLQISKNLIEKTKVIIYNKV